MMKKVVEKDKLVSVVLILAAFSLYFIWAIRLPVSKAPDEAMRYLVPKWIYTYSELPRGDEPAIRDDVWGFSYAFVPYLPSLVSVIFMRITSLFSVKEEMLIIASRMTSVLAGTGTIIFCLKIGNIVFNDKRYKYLFAILVAFLPQFAFLCSYLNNDAFAVFAGMIILYYWIKGIKEHWGVSSCVGLGIGLGLCALTYYNAYGYILCSIFIYCISALKGEKTIRGG